MKFRFADEEVTELADELIEDSDKHLGHLEGKRKYYLFADCFKGDAADDYGKVQVLSGLTALTLSGSMIHGSSAFIDPSEIQGWVILLNYDKWRLLKEEKTKLFVLYRALLGCSVDENGVPKIKKPEIRLHVEEVTVWGEDLPELKRIEELLAKRGQASLPFDGDTPIGGASAATGNNGYNGQDDGLTALPFSDLRQIAASGPLSLPAPPDPNVIEGDFVEETTEAAATTDPTDTADEDDDTPPAVAAYLDRHHAAEMGASDEDIRMVRNSRRIATRKEVAA